MPITPTVGLVPTTVPSTPTGFVADTAFPFLIAIVVVGVVVLAVAWWDSHRQG